MKLSKAMIAVFLLIAGSISAFGQADDQTLEAGFKPYGSYHGGDLDSINLSTGNLMLHIPVVGYPQRGEISYTAQLIYNNKGWSVFSNCNSQTGACSPEWQWKGKGVTFNTNSEDSFVAGQGPIAKGSTIMVYNAVTSDGATHQMATKAAGGVETLDGTGIWYDGTAFPNTGVSRNRRGVLANGADFEDANGNIFGSPSGLNMTDTVGRTLPTASAFTTTNDFSGLHRSPADCERYHILLPFLQ